MQSFLIGNIVAGILLIAKIQIFNLSMFIWLLMNLITMPIIALGEIWADLAMNKNAEELGFPIETKRKYFWILEAIYLNWIICSFINIPVYIQMLIFVIYKILGIGRLFYFLARVSFWNIICILSYVIFGFIYYNFYL